MKYKAKVKAWSVLGGEAGGLCPKHVCVCVCAGRYSMAALERGAHLLACDRVARASVRIASGDTSARLSACGSDRTSKGFLL